MEATRRDFMKKVAGTMTGIAVAGSSVLNASEALAATSTPKAKAVAKGRRLKVVDMHASVAVPEAMALMGKKSSAAGLVLSLPDRFKVMDEQGIDIEALASTPYWYGAERDLASKVVNLTNEKHAEICAANPDRFVAFSHVALQYPDLAIEQLEGCVKKFGMRGVSIGASVNGVPFSDPKFHPFWAKAEELGVLLFIHPMGMPELGKILSGEGQLHNVIANPLETTIALAHLIFEGTLDLFPKLKIYAAHGGGYFPAYVGRFDVGCLAVPPGCTVKLKKRPSEYLRQMYFDSLVFNSEGLRHLAAVVGASQIFLGTDYPYPWTTTAVEHIKTAEGLSAADRTAILSANAARVFGVKV